MKLDKLIAVARGVTPADLILANEIGRAHV